MGGDWDGVGVGLAAECVFRSRVLVDGWMDGEVVLLMRRRVC